MSYLEARAAFERQYWNHTLSESQGSIAAAARLAQVNRTAIYKMLNRAGVRPSREWGNEHYRGLK